MREIDVETRRSALLGSSSKGSSVRSSVSSDSSLLKTPMPATSSEVPARELSSRKTAQAINVHEEILEHKIDQGLLPSSLRRGNNKQVERKRQDGNNQSAGQTETSSTRLTGAKQSCFSPQAVACSALGDELQHLHKVILRHGGGIWALSEVPGVSEDTVREWEKVNKCPVAIEVLDFYRATDGLLVRWAVPLFGRVKDIGCIHINSLHYVVELEQGSLHGGALAGRRVFVLSNQKRVGCTALVYPRLFVRAEQPEVWFCDLSGFWHFLAASFSDYVRLLLVHLGVRGWEYAFTPAGLDPDTTQWLRLMAPERLAIDAARACFPIRDNDSSRAPATEREFSLDWVDAPKTQDDKYSVESDTSSSRGNVVKSKSGIPKKKKLSTSASRKQLVKRKVKTTKPSNGPVLRPESAPVRR